MAKFNDLSPQEKVMAGLGYGVLLTKLVDGGFDPLIDTDVREFLESDPVCLDVEEELAEFYELYDLMLDAA